MCIIFTSPEIGGGGGVVEGFALAPLHNVYATVLWYTVCIKKHGTSGKYFWRYEPC